MTEPNTRSGTSTTSLVFAVVSFVLVVIARNTDSLGAAGIASLLGILLAVAGLVLGIVAKRESSIILSAIALLFGLAVGFGVL